MTLSARRLGLAGGIVWGLVMFFTTLFYLYNGYGAAFLEAMGSVYPGYSLTLTGAFIGLIYGFFDAFIGLFVIAWLYNKIA